MAGRISALIRSVGDVDAPALGVWTAGELAAHLTHVFEIDLDLLNEVESPLADLDDLAEMTRVRVRDDAARDPLALARRVDEAAAAFLAVAEGLDGTESRLWLGGGEGNGVGPDLPHRQ